MNIFEMFALFIEVNIAIAGFAGIISAFRFRDRSSIRRGPVAALTIVVQLSLLVALFSCLPLLLHAFGVTDTLIWLVCSVIAVPVGLGLMYSSYHNMKLALRKKRYRLIHGIVQVVCFFAVIANILNVGNQVFYREPGPFLFAGVVMSSVAGLMFLRLLLNPLWKIVHENELLEKA